MEYKPYAAEPEDFAVTDNAEFELEWQLKRDSSTAQQTEKHTAEEQCAVASGPGTEYWLP